MYALLVTVLAVGAICCAALRYTRGRPMAMAGRHARHGHGVAARPERAQPRRDPGPVATALVSEREWRAWAARQFGPRTSLVLLVVDVIGVGALHEHDGHQVADVAVREVATRLSAFASSNPVLRLGAERFAVILNGTRRLDDLRIDLSGAIETPRGDVRLCPLIGAVGMAGRAHDLRARLHEAGRAAGAAGAAGDAEPHIFVPTRGPIRQSRAHLTLC